MEWQIPRCGRRFLKGDVGMVGEMVQRIMGSPDLYLAAGASRPLPSTSSPATMGLRSRDLVSYNDKHNLDNGENNNDGANDNNSWNCGVEGETDDPAINALRLPAAEECHRIAVGQPGTCP